MGKILLMTGELKGRLQSEKKTRVLFNFGRCTIVDTYFHASCVLGENMTKQHNLPSMREVLILEASVNSILHVSYTILLISYMVLWCFLLGLTHSSGISDSGE